MNIKIIRTLQGHINADLRRPRISIYFVRLFFTIRYFSHFFSEINIYLFFFVYLELHISHIDNPKYIFYSFFKKNLCPFHGFLYFYFAFLSPVLYRVQRRGSSNAT